MIPGIPGGTGIPWIFVISRFQDFFNFTKFREFTILNFILYEAFIDHHSIYF
jgi:hypothetical protein